MNVQPQTWDSLPSDNPIPLLKREKLAAEQVLVARVNLGAGCVVAQHHHPSEQVAIMLTGRAMWTLGHPGAEYQAEMVGGQLLHLPSGFPHGLTATQDCEIIDILSPPGAMGVDSQKS